MCIHRHLYKAELRRSQFVESSACHSFYACVRRRIASHCSIRLLLNAAHLSVQRRARRLVCSIAIALSFNNTRIFIALARSLTITRARTDRFCRQVPVDVDLTVGATWKKELSRDHVLSEEKDLDCGSRFVVFVFLLYKGRRYLAVCLLVVLIFRKVFERHLKESQPIFVTFKAAGNMLCLCLA